MDQKEKGTEGSDGFDGNAVEEDGDDTDTDSGSGSAMEEDIPVAVPPPSTGKKLLGIVKKLVASSALFLGARYLLKRAGILKSKSPQPKVIGNNAMPTVPMPPIKVD